MTGSTRSVIVACLCSVIVSVSGNSFGEYHYKQQDSSLNQEPLIGILSQPLFHDLENVSFIAASYVQFVEAAGARAVPIVYNDPKEKIIETFGKINGLILPGGTVGSDASSAELYDEVARMLLSLAWEKNMRNDTFAVHGFCMGFQMLMRFYSEQGDSILAKGFDSAEHANELLWTSKAGNSRLVGGDGPASTLRARMGQVPPIVLENHHEGIDIDSFYNDKYLPVHWDVLSHSKDRSGRVYVSTVEAKDPIAFSGTQWHPEKNAFEWKSHSIPHSSEAVAVSQFLANRFVDQARRSSHRPNSQADLDDLIIWNRPPVFHSPLVRDFELIFVYGPYKHLHMSNLAKRPSKKTLEAVARSKVFY
mmetsp:Transcript_2841/g.3210  ORF Transcript_2841/g.3210 Transcript_2841/m.3210 type:complete len:363 (-) Transcript_2841:63-1151(-)